MTTHSRGYDFNKKMVISVLMIVMIVDMVMMSDGYIMYMSVTYRPFLWRVIPMNYFQVRSRKTPQNLDLVLTPAADLFESSSKLPWPIHQYSQYESSLEITMVQPFLCCRGNCLPLFIWMFHLGLFLHPKLLNPTAFDGIQSLWLYL